MKVYSSLQKCRVELQKKNLKKSGHNKFAGYTYYELADVLPTINQLMLENNLTRLDFGGLCIDPIYDEDGKLIDESYSLRYSEFHRLHILKNH